MGSIKIVYKEKSLCVRLIEFLKKNGYTLSGTFIELDTHIETYVVGELNGCGERLWITLYDDNKLFISLMREFAHSIKEDVLIEVKPQ